MLTTRCVMEGIAASMRGNSRAIVTTAHVGAEDDAAAAPGLHAREGKQAGHLSGAPDEHDRRGAGAVALHLNLTLQQDGHGISRLALLKDGSVRVDKVLLAVCSQATDILRRSGR